MLFAVLVTKSLLAPIHPYIIRVIPIMYDMAIYLCDISFIRLFWPYRNGTYIIC